MTGAAMLDVAYALDVQSRDDHFMRLAEDANHAVAETANSGMYLVDALPICECNLRFHHSPETHGRQ